MQMDWGNNKDMTWTVGSNMYSMGDAKARIIYIETCLRQPPVGQF